MTVNLCTGLNESYPEPVVSVYPNPAIDEITFRISNPGSAFTIIELFNVFGQKVMDIFSGKIEQEEWKNSINISSLPKTVAGYPIET